MTKKEMAEHINANHCDKLFNLYERWSDEKEYEDFKDYVSAFKKSVPETLGGKKRPFAFIIGCSDGNLQVSVKVQGNYLKIFFGTAVA